MAYKKLGYQGPHGWFPGPRQKIHADPPHPAGLCELETISCSNHWVEASIPDEIRGVSAMNIFGFTLW